MSKLMTMSTGKGGYRNSGKRVKVLKICISSDVPGLLPFFRPVNSSQLFRSGQPSRRQQNGPPQNLREGTSRFWVEESSDPYPKPAPPQEFSKGERIMGGRKIAS